MKEESKTASAVMMMDVISTVLSHPDNMADTVSELSRTIRELTGARVTVIAVYSDTEAAYKILHVNPPRQAAVMKTDEGRRLVRTALGLGAATLWRSGAGKGEAEAVLDSMGFPLSLAIPLMLNGDTRGVILSLGLMDEDFIRPVLELQDILSKVVSIVLKNCLLIDELAVAKEKAETATKALWGEMELAKKIQTVLLPKKPEISGYEIAASCEPADEVGGDYYDVISVGGYDWIVIGDVSGHGVTSGLVMMMVQTSIHTVLIQNPHVPTSELLWVINRTIYENIVRMDEQKHMTILVIACGKDGFFDFSGLHEDILLWCAETRKVESIETDGMWIGLEPDIFGMLPVSEFRLGLGDCLILYTDGIIEARGKDGKLFGTERLTAVIEASGGKSASEIHAAILNGIRDFEKPDDVTLFVMKRV